MIIATTDINWSCRRGMKELELYLMPFVENIYPQLDTQQKESFKQLVKLDDLTLFNCLFKHTELAEQHLQALINQLKQYRQQCVANGFK